MSVKNKLTVALVLNSISLLLSITALVIKIVR
jgi:hypothetical protein